MASRGHILVADDERALRGVLQLHLVDAEFAFTSAGRARAPGPARRPSGAAPGWPVGPASVASDPGGGTLVRVCRPLVPAIATSAVGA